MKQVGNTILAKGGNHILAKRDNSAWPKGSKLSGFSRQLYYVNEELIEGFIDFMTCGSNDAVRIFLEKFTAEVRASAIYDALRLKPLYAVSHVCQLTADNRMQWPHIHVLWVIKKN